MFQSTQSPCELKVACRRYAIPRFETCKEGSNDLESTSEDCVEYFKEAKSLVMSPLEIFQKMELELWMPVGSHNAVRVMSVVG